MGRPAGYAGHHLTLETSVRAPLASSRTLAVLAALAAAPLALGAQANHTCRPGDDTNESKLLVFYSGPIAFSPGAPPERLRAGDVRFSVEATYVPSPAEGIRQPEACYGLEKKENTELSPVFPRPRLTVGLPAGFAFEASYLPPITVADATPNLGSVALSRTSNVVLLAGGRSLDLTVRAHGTMGLVRGSITCPAKALQQEAARFACFGTTESKDTFRPTTYGADGALSIGGPTSAWRAYLGAGALRLEPTFQVGFQQSDGFFDDTRIAIHRTRPTLFGGAGWTILPRAELSLELFSLPGSMTTARLGAGYRLR
jgi:hypothetical protein